MLPLAPLLAKRSAAVPPVIRASEEFVAIPEDALVELRVELFEDELEELEELEGPDALEVAEALEAAIVLGEALVGRKLLLPPPKPMADPMLPPTVIVWAVSLPAITSFPLLLSHAATFA